MFFFKLNSLDFNQIKTNPFCGYFGPRLQNGEQISFDEISVESFTIAKRDFYL